MRTWLVAILVLGLSVVAAVPAWAVIVLLKGNQPPIKAALVSQDAEKVVVREIRVDGASVEREFLRSEIEDIIVTVSAERLTALDRGQPNAYRNFAEELVEKREDPDARETAIRLYLIAAWLEPGRLGRSSLLSMAGLARSPAEERKFRAMAYLVDPQHDRSVLRAPNVAPRTVAGPTTQLPSALLKPLILLRQGKSQAARSLARQPTYRSKFEQIEQFLAYDEFLAACQNYGHDGLPPEVLRKILQIELTFSGYSAPVADAEPSPEGPDKPTATWSETVRLGRVEPVPSLSLETLTEFDPRKCVFRDGQWAEPKP
jgi:hypothetical protein